MLTLGRHVGQTICIGDDICLTVYDRMRYHLLMGVLLPPNASLRYGDMPLRPVVLPGGEQCYLLSLLNLDTLCICVPGWEPEQETQVRVRFNPMPVAAESSFRQAMIDIAAPRWVAVHREEIYLRVLRDRGQPPPALPFWAWLRNALHAPPRHAEA